MNRLQRLINLIDRIASKFNDVYSKLSNKLDSSTDSSNSGKYLKVDTSGNVVFEEENNLSPAPIDGKSYLLENGNWKEYIKTETLDWSQITSIPQDFTPSGHDHNDSYYTKVEVDNFLQGKEDLGHNHDDVYYTETEVDNLLSSKEDVVSKNTAYNKNFGTESGTVSEGDHSHPDLYYTKDEISQILTTVNTDHNHDDRYYTQDQINDIVANITNQGVDLSGYYTSLQVDDLLMSKSDLGHNHSDIYYSKAEIDALLSSISAGGFDETKYYTKTEIDALLASLEETVDVSIVSLGPGKSFGKYTDGDSIDSDFSIKELVVEAISENYKPEFFQPEFSIEPNLDSNLKLILGNNYSIPFTRVHESNDSGGLDIIKGFVNDEESNVDSLTSTLDVEIKKVNFFPKLKVYDRAFHLEGSSKSNTLGQLWPTEVFESYVDSNIVELDTYFPVLVNYGDSLNTSVGEFKEDFLVNSSETNFTINIPSNNRTFQLWIPNEFNLDSLVEKSFTYTEFISNVTSLPMEVTSYSNPIPGKVYNVEMDTYFLSNKLFEVTISPNLVIPVGIGNQAIGSTTVVADSGNVQSNSTTILGTTTLI